MSEMPEKWVMDKSTLPCLFPRVAVRKVARNDDQRTLRPALIPPQVFLNNTLIYFLWPEGEPEDEAYLLGVLNTILADWYARRFVETHLTFQVIKTFPIPRPGRDDPLRERVVELSGRLAAVDERYADWADENDVEVGSLDEEVQQDKIYELDAVVAHLYGLSREHVEVIFETFHVGWDHQERLDRVLDYYVKLGRQAILTTRIVKKIDGGHATMTEQPQFVDNRNGNTLSAAINAYLADLDDTLAADPDLDIVTGYFNPEATFQSPMGLITLIGSVFSSVQNRATRVRNAGGNREILGTRSTIKTNQ